MKKLVKKKTSPAAKPVTAAKVSTDATKPPVPAAGTTGTFGGYCVKCKEKDVQFKGTVVVSKTGMNMAQGQCPRCGTKMSRILGKAKPTS